ncbi:MAG: hypothetical protein PHC61_05405, partial [Chitinivibrionales bacterium]|nr:hypothetical protein [Chitinivibrionales bacterium]
MSGFIVEGKHKLSGTVAVSGNKNEALPLIAAALLCDKPITFSNVPEIGDVKSMLAIAAHLGARVSALQNGNVTIETPAIATTTLPGKLSAALRGSIMFASALLVRCGEASISQPGGDVIGQR